MNRTGLFLAASAASLLMSSGALAAPALPTGGSVAAGAAAISSSGSSMTISQATPKAIIDWQGFSIGQGGAVQFNNGSGATLNRVTGTSGSSIDGLLSGTGSVYLINPNGVIVGKSGVVSVGGTFVASTLNTADASFLSGGSLTFSGASTAEVVNEGKVGSLGGDVVLIASNVSNSGSLSAPSGTVGVLAGQSVLLRDQALNDGKFSVLVGGASTSATNSGLVEAANVELRANGGNVYALAGNTAGVVRATGAQAGQGHVWLIAEGGALDVAGTITARGPNGAGGTIETSGADVKIGASSIDAGVGGTWLVDPYDLTIDSAAAASISGALNAGTNVTEQTNANHAFGYGNANPSGNGDIFVEAPISWSTGATLSLLAWRNVNIDSPITVSGAGQVVLQALHGGFVGFGLGPSGFTGRLDFTAAEGSGQSLTVNSDPYTLIYTLAELAALNGSTGNAALANDLSPGSTYSDAVVKAFFGNFEGLGHVVHNLNINAPGVEQVGLFGSVSAGASVSNIGVAGGTVTGKDTVGDLAGSSNGAIDHSFATGAVNSTTGGYLGGLVGASGGQITWSYATGAVTAIDDGTDIYSGVGGLVGALIQQSASQWGSVDHTYATGAVSAPYNPSGSPSTASSNYVGGLVGLGVARSGVSTSFATGKVTGTGLVGGLVGGEAGNIQTSYATGEVVAGGDAGGLTGLMSGGTTQLSYALGLVQTPDPATSGALIGVKTGGTVSQSYYDGPGAANGATKLSTDQFKASLPAGFTSAFWAQIPGVSFPYLKDFYSAPPQVISGMVQTLAKPGSYLSGVTVVAALNGSTTVGSMTLLADGEFYFLEPAGTLTAGSTLVLNSPDGLAATALEHISGGNLTGVPMRQQYATIVSSDTSLSAMVTDLSSGLGSATAGVPFNVSGGALTLPSNYTLQLLPTGASFDFDESLDLGTDILALTALGPVTQSAGGITTRQLQGSSIGGLSLTSTANLIDQLHGWSDPTGVVSITDGERLPVAGAALVAGSVNLTTTSGDIAVNNPIRAGDGTVTLTSAGKVTETGAGLVASTALNVTAVGGVGLDGQNTGHSVSLQNSGGGALRYTNKGTLTVASASNAGGGAIFLVTTPAASGAATMNITGAVNGGTVTLTSGAIIKESGAGAITANILTGSAAGAVTLNGANQVAKLKDFADTAGDFALKDGQTLTLQGTIDGTGRTVSLTTTAGDIAVNGTVKAATLNLTSQTGALTESNSVGAIIASTLNAMAHTGITLASPGNNITTVGTDHTDSGPNTIVQ